MTHLVWKIANVAQEQCLQKCNVNRSENSRINPVIDTISVGEGKLKSSSLATFNKPIQGMAEGCRTVEDDIDDLPRNELQLNWGEGGLENQGTDE